jgi:uncharacterized protein YndB with AHSA1/START domain
MSNDRIERTILLHAPLERIWAAISDARQFGSWFGVSFDGPFAEETDSTGKIVPTTVDAEVARRQEPHKGKSFHLTVERIVPMRRISFRWHPFAIDPQVDYSMEPTTLIVFDLVPRQDGIELTITESGFDRIPAARRASAYAANEGGWTHQTRLLEKYLALQA